MHVDNSVWQIVAHLMIAFLFLFRCFTGMANFKEHAAKIASRGVPLAKLVLVGGFGFMLAGGTMVALGVREQIGAALLIVFTMAANYLYHNFWDLEGGERNRHLYIFCNNVAVMGGLVLVMVT